MSPNKAQLNVPRCRHSPAKRRSKRCDWQKMPGTRVILKKVSIGLYS